MILGSISNNTTNLVGKIVSDEKPESERELVTTSRNTFPLSITTARYTVPNAIRNVSCILFARLSFVHVLIHNVCNSAIVVHILLRSALN